MNAIQPSRETGPSLAKIPVTIVTGFLGAGKTTLIRHVLENAGGRRLALVINEFGDVGVDGEILRSCGIESCPEEAIVELANGCLCCTVADDFVPAIEALLAHDKRPDHIIVETSGLALPKPLVKAFDWPPIRQRLTVDGVIAVVDGAAVAAGRFADDPAKLAAQRAADEAVDHDNPLEEVYEDQLLCADLVILNKADLMDAATLARVSNEITATIPRAVKVVQTREGRIDADVLLGINAAAEDDLAARPSHHDAEEGHDHDDFDSFVLELPPVRDAAALVARLAAVAEAHDVLRIKGFVAVEGKPMRLLVQGVGTRFRHHFDRAWTPGETRASRLVVIGEKGLDREAITEALGHGAA
jgi:cobalamin biosynthesis protein CobW